MRHRKKLDSKNSLIKAVIELFNKLYKLSMETYYSNPDSKTKLYLRHTSSYNTRPRTNEKPYDNYKTMPINTKSIPAIQRS